jgi:putative oxidoreductase
MKSTIGTVGRILFAVPFAIFGLLHFMNADGMATMVPFPPELVWVYVTGLAHILAALSIIIQKKTGLATLLLGIMLLIFALTIHLPGVLSGDEATMAMSMPGLLKDLSLAGAAFYISSQYKD